MFSFFKKKPAAPAAAAPSVPAAGRAAAEPRRCRADAEPPSAAAGSPSCAQGLRKTGSSIAQVFTGTRIDDALYEELESALLMADAGVQATEFLLDDLKRRVKEAQGHRPGRGQGAAGRCHRRTARAAASSRCASASTRRR